MGEKIDMSLDDIIKLEGIRGQRGAGRGGRRGAARGARGVGMANRGQRGARRGNLVTGGPQKGFQSRGIRRRNMPYARPANIQDKWQHDMYESPRGRMGQGGHGGAAHLLVSNLDYEVSDADIQELFSEFGPLKKGAVHYDKSGRSLGTADVVFEMKSDALKAMNQYNGVLLDGRPMKIQLVTGDSSGSNIQTGMFKSGNKFGNRTNFGTSPRGRGRGRGGGGMGARQGNKKSVTAEELDADLDAYTNKMN